MPIKHQNPCLGRAPTHLKMKVSLGKRGGVSACGVVADRRGGEASRTTFGPPGQL
jgi:hypothetical protein